MNGCEGEGEDCTAGEGVLISSDQTLTWVPHSALPRSASVKRAVVRPSCDLLAPRELAVNSPDPVVYRRALMPGLWYTLCTRVVEVEVWCRWWRWKCGGGGGGVGLA